jgi:hypothetical protein
MRKKKALTFKVLNITESSVSFIKTFYCKCKAYKWCENHEKTLQYNLWKNLLEYCIIPTKNHANRHLLWPILSMHNWKQASAGIDPRRAWINSIMQGGDAFSHYTTSQNNVFNKYIIAYEFPYVNLKLISFTPWKVPQEVPLSLQHSEAPSYSS